jgi:tetrahydromethanopterin S-methyltransferase subunit G
MTDDTEERRIGNNSRDIAIIKGELYSIAGDKVGEEADLREITTAVGERFDELNEKVDKLNSRLSEIEKLVSPNSGTTPYDEMSKDQRVFRVREYLLQQAVNGESRELQYREIKSLFNGQPSDGYCYNLMELAAKADGFSYGRKGANDPNMQTGPKRITVNPGAVNDETLIHTVNNGGNDVPV